jgi:hypothetical protein
MSRSPRVGKPSWTQSEADAGLCEPIRETARQRGVLWIEELVADARVPRGPGHRTRLQVG